MGERRWRDEGGFPLVPTLTNIMQVLSPGSGFFKRVTQTRAALIGHGTQMTSLKHCSGTLVTAQ